MNLLKDDELKEAIESGHILQEGEWQEEGYNWFAKESMVQPASLDLHVGEIYLPPDSIELVPDVEHGLKDHVLQAGDTMIVTTREKLQLSPRYAAFGFPPTEVSGRGILMTNPGHIDPGFSGRLSFTLINMGRKSYQVRTGDTIVTLLVAELAGEAHKDYGARGYVPHRQVEPSPQTSDTADQERRAVQHDLNRLSKDFLNFKEQARSIAKKQIDRARLREAWMPLVTTLIAAILGAAAAFVVAQWGFWNSLEERVANLERKAQMVEMEDRVRELETLHDTQPGQDQRQGNNEPNAGQ